MTASTPTAHYENPILNADWPDPDAVRVGSDFYMVASSFNRSPGLPVLHSTDLVNWEIINHAIQEVPPHDHFSIPRHGGGVWAPSIRHHDGLFYIVFPDPDHGIYITTATDPAGEWSSPHLLLAGAGLIDPCPLWDEDGKTYLVFGWANSRCGQQNLLSVVETNSTLTMPLGPVRTVIDGDEIPECTTLEGPKFYKYRGYYWIFAPAGGVATGWQYAFRSTNPYGPYEERIVLHQGSQPVNGPHQGAWIDTPTGEHWFLHFQDRGVFGRVVHLQPMEWSSDDWPLIGVPSASQSPVSGPPGEEGQCGEPTLSFRYPQVSEQPVAALAQREPRKSDYFTGELGLQWHFQANRAAGTARSGSGYVEVPIACSDYGNLRTIGDVLTQQLPGIAVEVTTSLHLPNLSSGRAGLIVLGQEYGWIGVEFLDGAAHLVARKRTDPSPRLAEIDLAPPVDLAPPIDLAPSLELAPGNTHVELRFTSDASALIQFAWRLPGSESWTNVPQGFQAVRGQWIGAELGLFATSHSNPEESGQTAKFGPMLIVDVNTGAEL